MTPYLGPERRQSQRDRRQKTRSGKFDRRKNHCDQCHFYKPQSSTAGTCLKHQTMIAASDFSCVWFAPLGASKPMEEGSLEATSEEGESSDVEEMN